MRFRQATLKINDKSFALTPGRANVFDELYVDFQHNTERSDERWTVFLHPKQDLTVQQLVLEFDLPLPANSRFFANGYQSWSESRLMGLDESIPRLRTLARPYMGWYGDEMIPQVPRGNGNLHSWTYTYFTTSQPGFIRLLGSLNERTAYTLISYNRTNSTLTVQKDLSGLHLSHSFPALDLWMGQGEEGAVFDRYANALELPAFSGKKALGYTSWYRHFTHINETILRADLESVADSGFPFQYFQVDDGWQAAIGDWRTVSAGFAGGMARLAADIRAKGLKPGLWLAPFAAAAKSDLARRHPEWLLKDKSGKPLRAGYNPLWGGWYHALDFYNPQVQEYLSGVFHVVLENWGYDLVKLDFLFAACIAPPKGKTRAQVMNEVMEFLRRQVGRREILACGVPLGSAFGQADICRISGDIHLKWENSVMNFIHHRERVSTLAALRTTLARRHLNGRVFFNDPDVFILRSEGQHLTPEQQYTVLVVNALMGNVLFTSDAPGDWSPEQQSELQEALELLRVRVTQVQEVEPDVFILRFEGGKALVNLTSRKKAVEGLELEGWESVVC